MSSSFDPSWVHRGRVPCLDGYRAIGALLVVFAHSTKCAPNPIPVPVGLYRTIHWGVLAVNLFFVLSGFLITLLLLREVRARGCISLRSFYLRRLLRLLPAAAAFFVVLFILQWARAVSVSGRDWFAALTYTINFHEGACWELGHFWSLSIEEHFYLVWPVMLAILGLTGGKWALALCILLGPVARYLSHAYWSDYETLIWTFNYVDIIAFGAGLAFLCQSEKFHNLMARVQPICGSLLILVCLGLVGSAWLENRSGKYEILAHRTVTGFLCAALIYLSAGFCNKWVRRVLDWPPLVAIGVVSYSIYVWQQLFTGKSSLPELFSSWPTNLIFIAIAVILSYYLIERPFMRIKEQAGSKKTSHSGTPPAEPVCGRQLPPLHEPSGLQPQVDPSAAGFYLVRRLASEAE